MPIQIVRNDITKIHCDAIVNAANNSLLGGGGVDGAIHRAAGKGLLEECRTLGGCETGDAKITGAYDLPCRYVIHTVGPIWQGGNYGEEALLRSCYRKSLELAKQYKCELVAFPLISSGAYGYPKEEALHIAMDEISSFLFENDMFVMIVVFDKQSFRVSSKLIADITEYIDENYANENYIARNSINFPYGSANVPPQTEAPKEKRHSLFERRKRRRSDKDDTDNKTLFRSSAPSPIEKSPDQAWKKGDTISLEDIGLEQEMTDLSGSYKPHRSMVSDFEFVWSLGRLDELTEDIDESFSQMLLRKIDEKGMSDAECYKKANIDRKLFSKIRSNPMYKPSKPTALAFAIALELSLDETNDMLRKAGYALSHSSKFDIIIEFFIKCGVYNIFTINEALFEFDQPLLG